MLGELYFYHQYLNLIFSDKYLDLNISYQQSLYIQ